MTLTFKVNCKYCGVMFSAKHPGTMVCDNPDCRRQEFEARKTATACEVCGKPLDKTDGHPRKYCSTACRKAAAALREKIAREQTSTHISTCVVCGVSFTTKVHNKKCCSEECFSKWVARPEAKQRRKEATQRKKAADPEKFIAHERERQRAWRHKKRSHCNEWARNYNAEHHDDEWKAKRRAKRRAKTIEDNRVKAIAAQLDLQKYDIYPPMGHTAPKQDIAMYRDKLSIERLTLNKCKCLKCGNTFILCKGSNASHILKLRLQSGKRPCPYCGDGFVGLVGKSSYEDEIAKLFPSFTELRYRPECMGGYEIDLYDPTTKVGIDFHGATYHSERTNVDANYHKDKADKAEAAGIKLLQIYEQEWTLRKPCVINVINEALEQTANSSDDITYKVVHGKTDYVDDFLVEHHILGPCEYEYAVAEYKQSELVSVCCFAKETVWKLLRYAHKPNHSANGILTACGNLLSRVDSSITIIEAMIDRRLDVCLVDNLTQAGFVKIGTMGPSYVYTDCNSRHPLLSEEDMVSLNRDCDKTYYKMYDAGYHVYRYTMVA